MLSYGVVSKQCPFLRPENPPTSSSMAAAFRPTVAKPESSSVVLKQFLSLENPPASSSMAAPFRPTVATPESSSVVLKQFLSLENPPASSSVAAPFRPTVATPESSSVVLVDTSSIGILGDDSAELEAVAELEAAEAAAAARAAKKGTYAPAQLLFILKKKYQLAKKFIPKISNIFTDSQFNRDNVFAESGKSAPNLLDYDNLDLIASNLDPWAHLHDSDAKVF
jgi:hypothetical protein